MQTTEMQRLLLIRSKISIKDSLPAPWPMHANRKPIYTYRVHTSSVSTSNLHSTEWETNSKAVQIYVPIFLKFTVCMYSCLFCQLQWPLWNTLQHSTRPSFTHLLQSSTNWRLLNSGSAFMACGLFSFHAKWAMIYC